MKIKREIYCSETKGKVIFPSCFWFNTEINRYKNGVSTQVLKNQKQENRFELRKRKIPNQMDQSSQLWLTPKSEERKRYEW
jgi:hypothetical protein